MASPSSKVAPPDACAESIPVVPTTQRTFTTGHKVNAFVRVYRGARLAAGEIDVSVSLADVQGQEVRLHDERLTQQSMTERGYADLDVSLPMSKLSTGPHLILVEARSGDLVARKEAEITVR